MNAASSAGRSAANEPWNLSRSSRGKPSLGGRIGGPGTPVGKPAEERVDRLALVGGERHGQRVSDVGRTDDPDPHAILQLAPLHHGIQVAGWTASSRLTSGRERQRCLRPWM